MADNIPPTQSPTSALNDFADSMGVPLKLADPRDTAAETYIAASKLDGYLQRRIDALVEALATMATTGGGTAHSLTPAQAAERIGTLRSLQKNIPGNVGVLTYDNILGTSMKEALTRFVATEDPQSRQENVRELALAVEALGRREGMTVKFSIDHQKEANNG